MCTVGQILTIYLSIPTPSPNKDMAETFTQLALRKSPTEMLSVEAYIDATEYSEIHQPTMDLFWESVWGDNTICITSAIYAWMGYVSLQTRNDRSSYMRILANMPYTTVGPKHDDFHKHPLLVAEWADMKDSSRTSHRWVMLSVSTFRKTLCSLRTKRARIVRRYFDEIDELCRRYREYRHAFQIRELSDQLYAAQKGIADVKRQLAEARSCPELDKVQDHVNDLWRTFCVAQEF